MQLSFTTLGCPDWPLEQIIRNASAYGFDAVDFRGVAGEMAIYKLPEFSGQAKETYARITDAGLRVSCFSSSVHAFSTDNYETNLQEVREYARLCETFGTSYIRVFGGKIGDTDRTEAIRTTAGHLREMATIAGAFGVKVLVETHDDWMDCRHMRSVLEQADSEAVGVLWDLHHPYRVLGEQPEDTWNVLGPWIHYTHVKDSIPKPGDSAHPFQYCLTGEGNIPLKEMVALLHRNGYEGYYTLEWEKKWHPELENAEAAFPHYLQYMKRLKAEMLG
jgi:sugar phosphate isomerase/epimerase